jgi:hypothetical protein
MQGRLFGYLREIWEGVVMTIFLFTITALAAFALFFFFIYRPWHLHWGATAEELKRALPGDGMLFDSSFTATRAITVRARPEDVYPWIVQIGFGRAGWYSYDRLDNLGKPSADRIIPELQTIKIGDWIPMSAKVDERTAFRVAAFEPNKQILWTKPDSTWSWVFEPIDDQHTRVLSRLRCHHEPGTLLGFAGILLIELCDFPMYRKLLLNLWTRAEALAAERGQAKI